jgi:mono/diheme cytochrome c family protein
MTRSSLFASIGALAVAALAALPLAARQGAVSYPPAKPQTAAPAGTAARGAQLVMLGGCHDCHTPKLPSGELDMSRVLSGHPEKAPLAPEVVGGVSTNMLLTSWRGPWGVTLARNLTPDNETGTGKWTFEDFRKTIRTGVNPRGETVLPPMPIAMYQNLPETDLKAIYAYLRTLTPVRNQVGRLSAQASTPR